SLPATRSASRTAGEKAACREHGSRWSALSIWEAVTMEATAQRADGGADRREARGTVQLDFPHRERAERRHAAGESSFGCFVSLPALLAGDTGYEILVAGIPEGVMAVSAWLQEADDGVPMVAAARFQTEGVAL